MCAASVVKGLMERALVAEFGHNFQDLDLWQVEKFHRKRSRP